MSCKAAVGGSTMAMSARTTGGRTRQVRGPGLLASPIRRPPLLAQPAMSSLARESLPRKSLSPGNYKDVLGRAWRSSSCWFRASASKHLVRPTAKTPAAAMLEEAHNSEPRSFPPCRAKTAIVDQEVGPAARRFPVFPSRLSPKMGVLRVLDGSEKLQLHGPTEQLSAPSAKRVPHSQLALLLQGGPWNSFRVLRGPPGGYNGRRPGPQKSLQKNPVPRAPQSAVSHQDPTGLQKHHASNPSRGSMARLLLLRGRRPNL